MMCLMVRVFPRFLVGTQSRGGAWFGVLLIALLVVGSPARAAQPRLLAPSGAPVEDVEEHSSEALRESREEPVRPERSAHDTRRTPDPVAHTGHSQKLSPLRPDPFGNGLGTRLRC